MIQFNDKHKDALTQRQLKGVRKALQPLVNAVLEDGRRHPEVRDVLEAFLAGFMDSSNNVGACLRALGARTNHQQDNARAAFRAAFDEDFRDFLRDLRIVGAALVLLAMPRLKVKLVAVVAGFDAADHFHKVFKDVTGKSPGDFGDQPVPFTACYAYLVRPSSPPKAGERAFAEAVCPRCRPRLYGDVGENLQRHMRAALAPLPAKLHILDGGHLCDDCYVLVHKAVELARFALEANAFLVWGQYASATIPEDPRDDKPCVGLFVRLIDESEKLAYRDPLRRLELCRRAVNVAWMLNDERLVNMANIFVANALRAICKFTEARKVFNDVEVGYEIWLEGFYRRDRGKLASDAEEDDAEEMLSEAVACFDELDRHEGGLVCVDLAEEVKWKGRFEDALAILDKADRQIDRRRWQDADDLLPINRSFILIGLGKQPAARDSLAKEPRNKAFTSLHQGALGFLDLVEGRYTEAESTLEAAVQGFLAVEKNDNAVLSLIHLAAARAKNKDHAGALEAARVALTYSVAGIRTRKALRALRILVDETLSSSTLADALCDLARQAGGVPPA